MIQGVPPVFRGRIGFSLVCGTLLCLVFGSVSARAEDAPGNRATLKGIPAVRVIVAPMRMDAERDVHGRARYRVSEAVLRTKPRPGSKG